MRNACVRARTRVCVCVFSCSLCWPQTHYISELEDGLDISASTSRLCVPSCAVYHVVLGIKPRASTRIGQATSLA